MVKTASEKSEAFFLLARGKTAALTWELNIAKYAIVLYSQASAGKSCQGNKSMLL
jgi:hypothetical protein